MSIASRITSMENNIRNAYHSLDSIGIDTSNTNKNIENISELLDNFYDSLPKVSGSGSNISLSPTRKGRLGSVINGDTFQQTYTGKNLFDNTLTPNSLLNSTYQVLTTGIRAISTVNGTGTSNNNAVRYVVCDIENYIGQKITLSAHAKSSSSNKGFMYLRLCKENGDVTNTYGTQTSSETLDGDLSISYTIPSGIGEYHYLFVALYSVRNSAVAKDDYVDYTDLQLEGGDKSSYEPYVGGTASPNPDYPQEIKSVTGLQTIDITGKNIEDFNNIIYKEYNSTISRTTNQITVVGSTQSYASCQFEQRDLQLKPNTTYTFSAKIKSTTNTSGSLTFVSSGLTDNNTQQWGTQVSAGNTSYVTFTTPSTISDTAFIGLYTGGTNNEAVFTDIQLEEGNTATEYEPYQTPQEYEINLGKNLLKFPYAESSLTRDGITYTINNDGSIKISGTATATSYINLYSNLSTNLLEKGKTYTYSISPENSNIRLTILERYNNTWNDNGFGTNKITFTVSNNSEGQLIRLIVTNDSTINTTISPQIEVGNQATSYSPYFTPIHLYENDQIIGTPYNWSIKHVMGEVVLDGSENWADRPNYTYADRFVYGGSIERIANVGYSNYFQIKTVSSNDYPYLSINGSQTVINFSEKGTTTLAQFKTWLSTHNTKVVYELATPITEPITDTDLIEDLNNLYYAQSNDDTTNISVSGNLPMILSVSALKGE